jgi:hypothetical protein
MRVSRVAIAGSALAVRIGGGLAAYPTLDVGRRHRRVTPRMLERWGVTADRCRADAARNTAHLPGLVDEPAFSDSKIMRQIYHPDAEREAAALYFHLRHPRSDRGWVVSITHGSRAHVLRLDDAGARETIPVFAHVIADIYRRADAAADAHSSWLLWLTPDGRLLELFDVLRPIPPLSEMPAEFVRVVGRGRVN